MGVLKDKFNRLIYVIKTMIYELNVEEIRKGYNKKRFTM